MIRREINILASSSTEAGATNVSALGNRFQINLTEPIIIPNDATNVNVSMEESTVWWTVPNIITGINDRFVLTDTNVGTNPSATAYAYNITIPQGLYDMDGLSQAIEREMANEGNPVIVPRRITLSADSATQKVTITLNYTGLSVDFTIGDSFREILGFNSQILGPTVTSPLSFLSDDIAAFNQINSFLIHSDIVSRGMRFNGTYNQILDQVLIDVAPGSQIVQTKLRPPIIDENGLIGTSRNILRFWITDENGDNISTAGEVFTTRIAIRYEIPIKINPVLNRRN